MLGEWGQVAGFRLETPYAAGMAVVNLSKAEALLEIGRPRDALAVVGSVLAGDPQDVDALLVAARCHLELAEPRYAVSAATAALAQAPGYPDAWALASAAYIAAEDPDRAAWHAQQIMTRWPQLSAGYRAFAAARINQATFGAQVRAAAAQVMEMEPLDPGSHVLAAQAEMYPRQGRPNVPARRRARAHLVRALELDPHNVEALQEIATLAALGLGFARGLRGSAEVLQISPFEQAPLGAVAYIFRRLIWLVHLVIVVASFGCMFARSTSPSPLCASSRAPPPWRWRCCSRTSAGNWDDRPPRTCAPSRDAIRRASPGWHVSSCRWSA